MYLAGMSSITRVQATRQKILKFYWNMLKMKEVTQTMKSWLRRALLEAWLRYFHLKIEEYI